MDLEEVKNSVINESDKIDVLCDTTRQFHRGFLEGAFYVIRLLDAEIIDKYQLPWIPVEERRPEENKGVLVHYEDGEISKRYLEGRYFLPIRVVAVTHWMPLPEAPE